MGGGPTCLSVDHNFYDDSLNGQFLVCVLIWGS